MIDHRLRAIKDRAFEALARPLDRLSPNLVTAIGLALGLAAALCAATGQPILALVLFLLGRIADGLDGTLARLHRTQSDLGGYLDLIADFIVYAAFPIALVWAAPAPPWLALSVMLGFFYVNAASWMLLAAILESKGLRDAEQRTTVAMPTGLIEGAETIVFYVAFALWSTALGELMWLLSALVGVTIVQRVCWAVRRL